MKQICALLFLGVGLTCAAETVKEDDPAFFEDIQKLVRKHYPKAEVIAEAGELRFAFNTRKFMIHEPRKDGEWQDATEEVGPQKGGICGALKVEPGPYEGQAIVPQEIDKHYFVLWLAAPYSKKLDRHLRVELKYPRIAPNDFIKEFVERISTFEKLGTGK